MRLILINPPFGLIRELCHRQQHEFVIAEREIADYKQIFQNTRCSFLRLPSKKKISISATRQLRTTIQHFRPDIIHAFLPASLSQAILACTGLRLRPHILSFRGITRSPSRLDPTSWISYLSGRVSMHACESLAVKESLVHAGVSDRKCEVTYNCVEPALAVEGTAEIRQQLGIPQNAFVVGTVACIRPVKGIDVLLKAAAECSSLPNIYFVIVGENRDPQICQLACDERLRDRVKLCGFVANANRIMKAFDLFVMPSRREGLCRALLEAMDQSICPIISDAGGMKEVVRHQVDGIVFNSENVAELRDAITHLYHDREKISQFGQSARERAHHMCSPQIFADRLEAIYERLMRRPV